MAGKPKPMSQIKQLLILHEQGKGTKTIARILGISRNTVRSYLAKLDAVITGKQSICLRDLLKMENPELEAKFHPGSPSYKDDRYDHFIAQIDYFQAELKKTGVTKRLLWEEYRARHPDGYSHTQFCFHLRQHRMAARPTMVLRHSPGEKLFIDFAGKKLSYVDRQTGEVVPCQVFVACLPYSDYGFAMAVPTQSIEDFLFALSCCLSFLGGVTLALVPDNLKAAVVKASRYEPTITQALEDFANHYGTAVVPARVVKPRDKALVENQVKLIYQRVYAKLRNQQFFDLESLNKAIAEKMLAHNQTRMQQKPYCRQERFLAKEKEMLKPLPAERFEIKYYRQLTVAKNNYIYFSEDKHYYSVPYQLIGQKVKVVYTQRMVYCFYQGKQVAVHPRNYTASDHSTVPDHLCSQHQYYMGRSPDYYLTRGRNQSEVLYELMQKIFARKPFPEQSYRSCDGLLQLSKSFGLQQVESACQIALDHGKYTYGFVKRILENKMSSLPLENITEKALPDHPNLRGKEYYQQLTLNYKTNESD
jgi:transposase